METDSATGVCEKDESVPALRQFTSASIVPHRFAWNGLIYPVLFVWPYRCDHCGSTGSWVFSGSMVHPGLSLLNPGKSFRLSNWVTKKTFVYTEMTSKHTRAVTFHEPISTGAHDWAHANVGSPQFDPRDAFDRVPLGLAVRYPGWPGHRSRSLWTSIDPLKAFSRNKVVVLVFVRNGLPVF